MSHSAGSSFQVSAPGKLMLLGEHAVVHGRPCLVTAMDSRLYMTLTPTADDTFIIDAPDVDVEQVQGRVQDAFAGGEALARGTRFIESALAVFREEYGLPHGVRIRTRSDFASTIGLGSSSATVACALFGLAHLYDVALTPRRLFELGLDAIRGVQKLGSGFDLAAAVFGGTLYYEIKSTAEIIPLATPPLPMVVAHSGIKADTRTYVNRVTDRLERWPAAINQVFDIMAWLALDGRTALEEGEWARLGELLDMQHGLASTLGVDVVETSKLVFAARDAGAYGAKLSGAGGGDCVIALVPDERRAAVQDAFQSAGGTLVDIAPAAPGLRLESEGTLNDASHG